MMILKDEADRAIAEVGERRVGELERILFAEPIAAAGRPFKRAEQVEQRALAGAGRADDGERRRRPGG